MDKNKAKKKDLTDYRFLQDIEKLRKLKLTDKKIYKVKFAAVAGAWDISERQLRRYMNDPAPGVRKTRSDAGIEKNPVTEEEKKLISEAMLSGKTKKEAGQIASEKTGKKITAHKMQKVEPDPEIEETSYASEALAFFTALFEVDLVAPDAGLAVEFKDKKILIPKEHIRDVCLILADALELSSAPGSSIFVDREQLMHNDLFYLVKEALRIAKLRRFDIKTIRELTAAYKDLKPKEVELDTDYYIVERAMLKVNPKLTVSEIRSLLKLSAREINDGAK